MLTRSACALLLMVGCSHQEEVKRTNEVRAPAAETAAPPVTAKASSGPCPSEMVYVPGGTFMMGTNKDDRISPLHKVTLTKPYCIDRLEVTLADYHACEKAGGCKQTKVMREGNHSGGPLCNERMGDRESHPINCITWDEAFTYCRFRNKRLPSEAEWEFAARGPESFKFPWGNHPPAEDLAWNSMYIAINHDYDKCADMGPEICPKSGRHAARGTIEGGRFPKGASPFGVLDMGGNLAEWVQDWSVYSPLMAEDAVDPVGPREGLERVIKDISWDGGAAGYTVADRLGNSPDDYISHTLGARCASRPPTAR